MGDEAQAHNRRVFLLSVLAFLSLVGAGYIGWQHVTMTPIVAAVTASARLHLPPNHPAQDPRSVQ
jgi:hypothetical protein